MKKKLTQITSRNLESLFSPISSTVLLACIHHDNDFDKYLQTLSQVSQNITKNIEICFVIDEMLPYFMTKFNFEGTPTYILLERGNTIGCLRGQSQTEDLVKFINSNFLHKQGEQL